MSPDRCQTAGKKKKKEVQFTRQEREKNKYSQGGTRVDPLFTKLDINQLAVTQLRRKMNKDEIFITVA